MRMARAASTTLADAFWPADGTNQLTRGVVLTLLGSALLIASAKVQVPFYPVPMTMQTMVVLLLGMTLGPWLALAAVLVYLTEGAFGLPVFAGTPEKGIGLAYMAGPTGGYLIGFALAAWVAGMVAGRRPNLKRLSVAALAGILAIYVPGALWLSTLVGPGQAIVAGIAPFVLGDLLKGALAVALAGGAAALLERRKNA
jgi:biotin transport system substrate-specific component